MDSKDLKSQFTAETGLDPNVNNQAYTAWLENRNLSLGGMNSCSLSGLRKSSPDLIFKVEEGDIHGDSL